MRLHVKEDFPNSIDGLASGMGQGNPEYLRTLILIAAAVLAELTETVYSIEIVPELAASAEKRLAALGYRGWPEAAPKNGRFTPLWWLTSGANPKVGSLSA